MFIREFFHAGVAPARGLILARSRAVAGWAQAVWLICLLASLLPSVYAQTLSGTLTGTNTVNDATTLVGNITNNGVLIINKTTTSFSLTNLISGTGSFRAIVAASPTGGITVSGANSYGGETRVDSSSSGSRANFILNNPTGAALYNGTNGQIVIGNSVYLQTLAANQLGTNVSIRWNVTNNANFGYFVLRGQNQSIGNLDPGTDAARAVIENTESETGVANSILTIHQTSDVVFPGFIRNTSTGSGTLGLIKNGSGKLTLTGANISYTGTSVVNEGEMVLSNATAYVSATTVQNSGVVQLIGSVGAGASVVATNGGTVEGSGTIPSLSIRSNGLVKITSASTNSAGAWNTGGTINFNSGSKIDVTGLSLSQQPYVLIRGSSVSGTPILQGATGFTVANTSNSITLTPAFTYTINNGEVTITGYTGTGGDVVIPATIGGLPVTTIGQNAFQSKTSVTSVVIPNGVITILDAAFAGCSSMTAITLPNSLTSIGNYVFDGCSSLQSIAIPDGVTSIGANAFAFCTSLPSITLPSGLNKIMSGTFWTCSNLTSITIPSSVNEIQYNAFLNCSKLASVTFLRNTPPTFGNPTPFGGIAPGAKGYYPATAGVAWGSVTVAGLTFVQPDTQSPVITLIGANPLQIYKGATFSDLGATVTDNVDTTRTITGSGTVNTAIVGNYTLNYNTTDVAGNPAVQVTRTVNVVLDPNGDEDGDGVSNGAETSAGTSPFLKPSFPDNAFSVVFNGTSTQRVISPRPVQDDFTFSFWIKTSAAGSGSTQWYQGRGLLDGEVGGVTDDFGTSLMEGGKVGLGVGNPDTTLISSKSVNDNSWHHVAFTRVAVTGTMMIYIDGVLDRSLTGPTGSKSAPPRLTVGSLQTNINYFSGEMADFRIYDQAASGAEVWQLANRISTTGSPAVATLSIVNFDFETGGLIDDRYSSSPGFIPTGWQAVPGAAPGGVFYGYYNPINDAGVYISGVSGNPGITGTMSGPNVFYFGSATNGQGIQQTLSSTFSLSTDYTLTVARGTRNGTYNNTLRMQLFAGSTLLTSRDVAPEPAGSRGTFLDYSTTYVASVANNSANAVLVGQPLIIRFLEIDNPGNPQAEVDIDNIRLVSAAGVSEPSSGMLSGASVATLLVDADADGLDDAIDPDPTKADTDGDGLTDGQEVNVYGTNPSLADTDGDGASDKLEVDLGNSATVANVYNRLINGSFEDGTVKPSPGGNLPTHQNNVPGWKTTASNNFIIELWYSGFLGSSGNVGNTLAELNYIASGTLYQDVTMTVNSPVSYSFLHRGRDGTDVMDFKIDELSGGPGTSVVNNKFTRRVTTGTSWVRYSGSQAASVEIGKTYRFSYTSISPTGGNGNLLDDASFGIDQDADGLLDYEEIALGTNPLLSDTDGDGFSDGVEVKAGSSPTSADGTPLPEIVADPVGATKEFGQSYRFEVLASGLGLTYQWKRDGQNVIGGSNPYLELASLTVSDSGSYAVTVSNSYGSVTSSPVYLSVTQALISSGFSHSLYLATGAATVTAWGLNTDGRLGVGDTASPVNWAKAVQGIPVGVTVDALSAGGTHSLILAGGQVYAAGSDRFGQLGQGAVNGANKTSFTSVVVPSSTTVAVAAGGNHSLIVTASGKVFAFGDNTYGQLARSSTTVSSGTLVEVNFPGLSTKIVSVVAGADHNLAVDENGGVWVWGRNDSGQLGKNTRTLGVVADRTPVRIISSGAKSVAAGFAHSLVLKQDGTVLGFGRNTVGQAGQSSGTSYPRLPTPISGLSGIRSIAAGTDSSFAIDQAGQLRSWGYNAYGELLLGNASPSSSPAVYGPTPSPIATNVSNVAGGGYSSLAVGAQGVIFGGRNDVGQSGNGPDPEQVVGDYYYGAGNLTLNNLTMDLAGTTETLYDQIFVGSGTATLNGILNLMFVGTYSGPVYGSTQTFDLIWAKNGIVLGTGYEMAFNQAGYLVESAVTDKSVEGVSGKVLQATIRAVVTAADLAKAVDLASPSLDGVESVSYGGSTGVGIRTLSLSPGVEMIYSYERPTGGVSSGGEYFVDGLTYRVEQVSSLTGAWGDALVSGTTVTPVGNGYERATLRISSSGGAGFLRLQVESPQAAGINVGVGSAVTY